jgi:hypothetical protein
MFIASLCSGCVDDDLPPDPPYRARVLALSGYDLANDRAVFELGTREMRKVIDMRELISPYFRVLRGGTLRIDEVNGELIEHSRFESGRSPDLRYAVEGGVMVARDYQSLIMLSVFYNLHELFDELEQTTGTSADVWVQDHGPFEVLFEPEIRLRGIVAAQKFNAFYARGTHQFGVAQRSPIEEVPVAGSKLVLAHELGHALSDHSFASQDGECQPSREKGRDALFPGRLGKEFAIRGLEEGDADFRSFVHNGSTSPLSGISRLIHEEERSLIRAAFRYAELTTLPHCNRSFYCIGTLYARALFKAYRALGHDPRDEIARASFARDVMAARSRAYATMRAEKLLPPPSDEVVSCTIAKLHEPTYDGQVIGAFLSAFTANLPPGIRPAICTELVEQFGDLGFPSNARGACR